MQVIDSQTLKELEIFSSSEGKLCLLDKLDFTITPGGRAKLKEKLSQYHTSLEEIKTIQKGLQYLLQDLQNWEMKLHKEEIIQLQDYFNSNISPILSATKADTFIQILRYQILYKAEYAYIRGGTFRLIHFLQKVEKLLHQHDYTALPALLQNWVDKLRSILTYKDIAKALQKTAQDKLDFIAIVEYDKVFRIKLKDKLDELFELLYELDAWLSMAKSISQYALVFPQFIQSNRPCIELKNLYHLFLRAPVHNDISFAADTNFLFLTGPNTAGKTTLLKACGMALYLAHVGMGVPASSARLSLFTGVFSSISVTDNLIGGYSYFYSEVLRIKQAVDEMKDNKCVFCMFDELFRGTNVKDAYDCSKLVIAGLQPFTNSVFIVSSHITELATDMQQYPNMSFGYMESAVTNHQPVFSYKLAQGVSKERLGLVILQNEKIFG